MTQFVFGTGTLVGKRTDVTGTPPALLGTLQDVSIDFDRKVETLLGQYAMAVAAGGGELKITGKAKFARLQATTVNNLFLGQTLTSSGMLEMATAESVTVDSGSATVANGATFTEDFGVFNPSTGVALSPVASSPVAGVSYVPGAASTGTYTFASGDFGQSYLIFYQYTTSSSGTRRASRCWSAPRASRSPRPCPSCCAAKASRTRSSTPSTTRKKPRSSQRPASSTRAPTANSRATSP